MKKKAITQLTAITAVFLCFALIFGSLAAFAADNSNPDAIDDKTSVIFPFVLFRSQPDFAFSSIKKIFFYGKKVKILGYSGKFTYVEVVSTKEKGYIFHIFIEDDEEGELKTAKSVYCVYEGKKRTSHIKINYNGNKNISWELSKPGIVEVTKESDGNLSIKGLSPGSVTLTIKAGLLGRKECTLFCIYEWKIPWTGKATKDTYVRKGAGDNYDYREEISSGDKFIVSGDDGSSNGWAYGNISGTDTWGFVKINDISTKGTVSQYNNMGWSYPIKNTKFKNIFSVYGWRNNSRHLGFDINKTPYSSIQGEPIVSPCYGKVVFSNKSYDYTTKEPNYGYCIIVESTEKDPVSGNKLRVVYMHLNEPPIYSAGKEVYPGQELGFIGTTGNSTGPHLHLEINNKGTNFAGSGNIDSFDKTINPIFFFLNSGLKDDSDSTYNEYWYNDNK